MAKILKLKVIAEGVETSEQLAFLQENDCGAIQGFFLGQPVTCREFMKLLNTKMLVNSEGKLREDG
jgi:EAL domain-containing protein (putative c-di-GMP-specific phosphodiesterase class I)